MSKLLTALSYLGLGAILVVVFSMNTSQHEMEARAALWKAGYDASNMNAVLFGCAKGRSGYTIKVENGASVKVCVGGFVEPVITVL